ncbi:DUF1304-domain-containing protein [Didymella exigua CBS 183.55]|uniref:DUF1304-domain-containing protein n=1 Tax=Didymella exigua CBS 183.55 TaxID=1150837 RepID=A0A6A5S184_9PLEO|nr:DUF1304-domain-containing protein [Didymella exigua CBS 183.55]KAF1933048.1 DUF1304-domain-containing protein [Didymella exigua CBS 183.55]
MVSVAFRIVGCLLIDHNKTRSNFTRSQTINHHSTQLSSYTRMTFLASVTVFLLAALHAYIMALEMFLWTSPAGLRAFALKPDFAAQTKAMAANQGLYNGFLAAGLAWSLVHPSAEFAPQIARFFAGCVLVAGIYGGFTANRKIFFVQGLPGALCLAAVIFA